MSMGKRDFGIVGKPIPVKDAKEKVTGALKYAVDFEVQGMVHGKILRCPHPHARVIRIDASRALALPGVIGIVTHEDAPGLEWHGCWFNYRGKIIDGIGRFAGDELGAVAAVSSAIAEEALNLIEVEYELLAAVFDPEAALLPDAPQVRDDGNAREPVVTEWGNIAAGREAADHVIETTMQFGSQQMASIGRNACIAEWNGDRLTLWTSSQTPSELRDGLAQGLGIAQSKVRVQAFPTGSSFGMWWSNNFMLVTALLARKIRRPVKIELDNEECFGTVKRRHKERTRGSIGYTKEGDITFIDVHHIIDNGAYGYKNEVGYFCCDNWGTVPHGHYVVQGVSTNLVTAGCMRGVGDVTLGTCVERMHDMVAERLGIDPLSFRIAKQVKDGDRLRSAMGQDAVMGDIDRYLDRLPDELRERMPKPFHLSSGSTHDILVRGGKEFGFASRWKGWGKPYEVSGRKSRAVGVATGIHCCGVEFEGNTNAMVRINPDGSVKLHCAVGRQGQGSETTLSQVASETLGIPIGMVEIETGDTDSCPWSHGSIASNTMYRTGFAAWAACLDARRQILDIAARNIFDSDPAALDIKDGLVFQKPATQGSNRAVPIAELMHLIRNDALGQQSSIVGRPAFAMPPSTTFARHFAAHFVDLEVDLETGEIRLLDYLAAQDSGTVVNPQVLKNQVIGGAICGAGFALYEELVFDETSGKVRNAGLLDYKLLRTPDFPASAKVLFGDSYDPVGPFGARGAGEAPIAAAVPAICQAVYNATGHWFDIPMTPERIAMRLLEHKRAA
jgi:CO/xanthine dehydrogenase Mo-binding subunit